MKKTFNCLCLISILSFGLVLLSPNFYVANATTDANKPSVPEFSVRYVDYSYDVEPGYGTDQFTGEKIVTKAGYHVYKRSVEFNITNQPFTPYTDSSGNEIKLYFTFKYKGHFGSKWNYYPFPENENVFCLSFPFAAFGSPVYLSPKFPASGSDYTNLTLNLEYLISETTPAGSLIDFQVQALMGHIEYVGNGSYEFTGQKSDWSDTQTVILSENIQITDSVPENEVSGLSVPEFTVSFVDNSYNVPTTYSVDPFTGANITHSGHSVEKKSIEIAIKNQPFTSTEINGNPTQLFYVVRWKGHFADWTGYDKPGLSVVGFNADFDYYLENYGVEASNSDYTIVSYSLESFGYVPDDGQIDFQVKTQVGYTYGYYGDHAPLLPIGINFKVVEESEWSNIQTFSFAEKAVIPEFPSWMVLPFFVVTTIAVIVCRKRLDKKKKS